jgi:PAS domain S-box-containing protein
MLGTYDSPLVTLSIVIAILASYTALALAARVTVARDGARRAWLLGGSITMGTGIWSMHFVAMLAFQLPVPIAYDVPLVALSLLAGIAASGFALVVASRATLNALQLTAGALVMGGGIATMHYTGMAAMRMPAHLHYDLWLVALSGLIAVSASAVALWIFRQLRHDQGDKRWWLRVGASMLLGFAITGLHYTAMTAAHFASVTTAFAPTGLVIASSGVATSVIVATLLILVLTLLGSIVDHWVGVRLAGADALRESEERYRSVVSQVHEVIFRADENQRWTFLNPAWTEITGFTEEETLGRSIFDCVHPEERPMAMLAFRAMAEGTRSSSRHEGRYLTKTGDIRWMEVHVRVSRDAGGTCTGVAGTLRDVTERRHAEEALRNAREAAEAASRAKSEFLSRMSHELRTPLNAILGFGQLLEIEDLSPENQESVGHILRGGRHLLDLINEVLDISGIEAGRLRLSPEPVGVSEVAREVLELLQPVAAQRAIVLRAHGAKGCASHVMADRQRLKQVVLNLISNAIKYNRHGGHVVVTVEEAEGEHLRIVVRDSGNGIPPERMERLFMPFERLGAEQTSVEGTGLGLALSKRLAEAMGGSMGALGSGVDGGQGSTFWIELPLAEGQIERWERLDKNAHDAASTHAEARGRTILYVEDNLANLTLVQRILARRPGLNLIPCMQGELALDLARVHRPELILLDLHLPDISGEEVLRRLRRIPETRDIPVIIVSADATSSVRERLATDVQGILTKPIDVAQFLQAVDASRVERPVAA